MIAFLLLCVTFSVVGMEQPHLEQQPSEILNAYHAPIIERTIKLQYEKPYLGLEHISLSSHATNYIAGTDGGFPQGYTLHLGTLDNGRLKPILTLPESIHDITFNKNDSVIAASSYRGSINLININNNSRSEIKYLCPESWLKLESHPEKENLLFVGYSHNIEISLWDINQLARPAKISLSSDPEEKRLDLKYQQEQSLLAVKANKNIYLWDIRTQKPDQLCKNYSYDGNISWNPTNTYEIAIPHKKSLTIIDIRTKNIIESIPCDEYIKVTAFITASLVLIHNHRLNHMYNRTTQELQKWNYSSYIGPQFHHRSFRQTFNDLFIGKFCKFLRIYDFSQLAENIVATK